MTRKQQAQVMAVVESEGFDYAFCYHSNFEEINDKKFHKVRTAYIKAARNLKKSIGFYVEDKK